MVWGRGRVILFYFSPLSLSLSILPPPISIRIASFDLSRYFSSARGFLIFFSPLARRIPDAHRGRGRGEGLNCYKKPRLSWARACISRGREWEHANMQIRFTNITEAPWPSTVTETEYLNSTWQYSIYRVCLTFYIVIIYAFKGKITGSARGWKC